MQPSDQPIKAQPIEAQPIEAVPVEEEIRTGIYLDLSFFPLAFVLLACTPAVEINGYPQSFSWGRHFVPLEPGTYRVKISFPYLFIKECGANETQVSLQQGEVRTIKYYMWPFVFMPGSITVS